VTCVDEKIDAGADEGHQHDVKEYLVVIHALGFAAFGAVAALEEIDDLIGQQPDKVAGAER